MEGETKEEKNPLISVVIPCFRAGELLADAIESVLAQTETDWELILVDNNASEETKEVISRFVRLFPKKIRGVHEPDQGNSSARNRGLKEAQGTYIAFLDDDDQMYPERLSLQVEVLSKQPDAVLCFGGIDWVTFDNSKIIRYSAREADFPFFRESSRYLKDSPRLTFPDSWTSSVMTRRSIIEKVGGFDPHFNPFFMEETDFYFRLAQIGPFVTVDQPVIRFRMASPEFLRKKRIDNVRKFWLILNKDYFFSKIKNFLEEKTFGKSLYQKGFKKNEGKVPSKDRLRFSRYP